MTKREICRGLFKAIGYLDDYKRSLWNDKRAKKSFNFDDLSRSVDTICEAILALVPDDPLPSTRMRWESGKALNTKDEEEMK